MVEVNCSTGGMSVIASGIGITYSRDADYDIHLEFKDGFAFTVRLKFRNNDPNGTSQIRTTTDKESHTITVECQNTDDEIGSGTTRPFELATWHGGKVSMNFWVRASEDGKNREVRYCFYWEGKDGL